MAKKQKLIIGIGLGVFASILIALTVAFSVLYAVSYQPNSNTDGYLGAEEGSETHPYDSDMRVQTVAEVISTNQLKVTARVYPYNATDKSVGWSLSWDDPESEWASGKDISEYLTLEKDGSDSTIVTLTNHQAFGETILLTCYSEKNPDVRDSITVDYYATIIDFVAKFTYNGTEYTFSKDDSPQAVETQFGPDAARVFAPAINIPYSGQSGRITNFTVEPVYSGVYSAIDPNFSSFINVGVSATKKDNYYLVSYNKQLEDIDENKLALSDQPNVSKQTMTFLDFNPDMFGGTIPDDIEITNFIYEVKVNSFSEFFGKAANTVSQPYITCVNDLLKRQNMDEVMIAISLNKYYRMYQKGNSGTMGYNKDVVGTMNIIFE